MCDNFDAEAENIVRTFCIETQHENFTVIYISCQSFFMLIEAHKGKNNLHKNFQSHVVNMISFDHVTVLRGLEF